MSGSLAPSLPTPLPDPAFLAEIQRVLQPYRDAAAGSQDMPSSAPSAVQGLARVAQQQSGAPSQPVQAPASSDQNPGLPDWAGGSRRAPSQPTQATPQSGGAALSGRVDPQAALGFDPSDVLPAKGTALLDSLPAIGQPTAGMVARGVPTSQTSVLDSLAPAQPTSGMLAAGTVPQAGGSGGRVDPMQALGIDPSDVQPKAAGGQQVPDVSTWGGMAKAVPAGAYRGLADTLNAPTALWNLGARGVSALGGPDASLQPPVNPDWLANKMGYSPHGTPERALYAGGQGIGMLPGLALGGAAAGAALGAGGELAADALPQAIAPAVARAAGATGNFISGATAPSAGAAASTFAGGVGGQAASERVSPENAPYANLAGSLAAGGLVGGIGAAGRAIGGAIEPEVAQLAQLARDTYNIPIRAGQISGDRIIRSADSALQSVPLSGLQGAAEVQQTALNKAVANTFGEDADKITPSVMNAARRRIGGVMEDVENRNSIQFDPQLGQDLSGIVQNARMALTDPEFNVVGRQVNNLLSTVQPGAQISGQSYGNLIHKGSPLDVLMNSSNSNLANYGGQIREALRNSLQRSLSPEDVSAYQTARSQWKNMKTVEPLLNRADVVGGATPSTGDIIPSQLRGVVNRSFPTAAYAEPGQVPLNDLANIGQRFLKETPTSQTSERSNIFRWLERGGAVAGGLLGGEHYLGVPMGEMMAPAAAAGAATLGLGRVAGKVLGSEGLANRMIQRGLGAPAQGPGIVQRSVPLMTSSGIRQMSPPPEQPQTSRNPQTGLPEYSLRANQEAAASQQSGGMQPGGGATDVASKLLDGSLTTHAATQEWINANKDGLRQRFGGQGLQNIARVAALMRKASDVNAPPTVMSALVNGTPPQPVQDAFRNIGVRTPEDLVSLAVTSPGLAKELSAKGALRVPRLTAAIRGALN